MRWAMWLLEQSQGISSNNWIETGASAKICKYNWCGESIYPWWNTRDLKFIDVKTSHNAKSISQKVLIDNADAICTIYSNYLLQLRISIECLFIWRSPFHFNIKNSISGIWRVPCAPMLKSICFYLGFHWISATVNSCQARAKISGFT